MKKRIDLYCIIIYNTLIENKRNHGEVLFIFAYLNLMIFLIFMYGLHRQIVLLVFFLS